MYNKHNDLSKNLYDNILYMYIYIYMYVLKPT